MRRALVFAVVLGLVALALPMAARADGPECEWLAGDFHAHTVYSHDSYGGPDDPGTGPDEFYTFGWTPGQQGAIAESRDLDFIAITDHDNVDGYLNREGAATGVGLYESGWGRQDQLPGGDPLIWVPDYEANVSDAGHAQMHGATHAYPKQSFPEMAAAIRADDGAFQINHPSDMKWHDDAGNYEYPGIAPDALEIWNIGVWLYEPPAEATNDHEFTPRMYDEEFLDPGFHVAATGGSDNHWRSTTAVQGVGQPTTWVCAASRDARGIIDGVLANHTTISHQPPQYMGAVAYLDADKDGDGSFESMLGDTVPPGSTIQARVDGAEGATLRLITNGSTILAEAQIDAFNYAKTFEIPTDSTWVRAEVFYPDGLEARNELQPLCDLSNQFFGDEPDSRNTYCENRLAVVAMTSPIYFQAPEPEFDPATTLTYDGSTTVKAGRTATLSATLLDSEGQALVGQPIAFTFRDQVYSGTTDGDGRASVQLKIAGPPGNYDVISDFAGNNTYDASHDHDVIGVTAR